MPATDPAQLVERYLQAVAARDFEQARTLLADRGFEYLSPIARFDDADAFIDSMMGVGAIMQRMEIPYAFESGDDVCHVLDVTVAMASYETQRVIHLAHVEADRIDRIEVIFDASSYHRMVGRQVDTSSDA